MRKTIFHGRNLNFDFCFLFIFCQLFFSSTPLLLPPVVAAAFPVVSPLQSGPQILVIPALPPLLPVVPSLLLTSLPLLFAFDLRLEPFKTVLPCGQPSSKWPADP